MRGDYLWDGSGDPDPEVVRLERVLRAARYDEAADLTDRPALRRRRRRIGPAVALGALAAAAVVLIVWQGRDPQRTAARVETAPVSVKPLAGAPLLGDTEVAPGRLLRPGEWLTTDGASRALIELGGIGEVTIGTDSRVRLVDGGPDQRRLQLGVGVLHARVYSAPRLFLVDLPSATAIDLGCEYELVVDRSGAGTLRVSSGEVSLEGHGRAALVPAGSECDTRPGHGPGTPHRTGASRRLISALRRYDFEGGGSAALVDALEAASERDTLPLWHLIERSSGQDRARVIARLAGLAPPPPGIKVDEGAPLDAAALDEWRRELEADW
jgi:ferric-dicitrate binding protein FerR (iron transport regulator)